MTRPFDNMRIDQLFQNDPSKKLHEGWDASLIGTSGNQDCGTPLKAVLTGEIIHTSSSNKWYGNLLVLKVETARGIRYVRYCHLIELPGFPRFVNEGEIICNMGSTGNSTACHLHLDILKRVPPNNDWRFFTTKDFDMYWEDPSIFFNDVGGNIMEPNFKEAFLSIGKLYGDQYNEQWNPAEKKTYVQKIITKCEEYKKKAETPVNLPNPITTPISDAGDALIIAGNLLKGKK